MNRVERLIRESFLELMQTESFYNIHVKDILEKEHISRTSFYKYYKDKYDLLNKIEMDMLDEFDTFLKENVHPKAEGTFLYGIPSDPETFTLIFQFANDHYDILNSLFGPNGDGLFTEKVIAHITQQPYLLLDSKAMVEAFSPAQWETVNAFLSNGYMGIVLSWFKQGKRRKSAEEMGQLLAGIVKAFFSVISMDLFSEDMFKFAMDD